MLRRDISQLAVYSIEQETEELPLEYLRNLYLYKTSEIVYVVKDRELYGVICMEDILNSVQTSVWGGG